MLYIMFFEGICHHISRSGHTVENVLHYIGDGPQPCNAYLACPLVGGTNSIISIDPQVFECVPCIGLIYWEDDKH